MEHASVFKHFGRLIGRTSLWKEDPKLLEIKFAQQEDTLPGIFIKSLQVALLEKPQGLLQQFQT